MRYLFLFCLAILTGGYSHEGGASFNLEEEIGRPEVVNMLRQPGRRFNALMNAVDAEQRRTNTHLNDLRRASGQVRRTLENELAAAGLSNSSSAAEMRTLLAREEIEARRGILDNPVTGITKVYSLVAAKRPLLDAIEQDAQECLETLKRGKSNEQVVLLLLNAYDPTFNRDMAQRIISRLEKYVEGNQEAQSIMSRYNASFLREAEALDETNKRDYQAAIEAIKAQLGAK